KEPRADIEAAAALLLKARELAHFKGGRHKVKWNADDPLDTPLPHLHTTDAIVQWLALDAEVFAHEGKINEALESIHAALVAGRLPSEEQAPRLKELAATATAADVPPGTAPLLAGFPIAEMSETCNKGRALLLCAAAGLALERYRLANNRWPEKLDELAPKYL